MPGYLSEAHSAISHNVTWCNTVLHSTILGGYPGHIYQRRALSHYRGRGFGQGLRTTAMMMILVFDENVEVKNHYIGDHSNLHLLMLLYLFT